VGTWAFLRSNDEHATYRRVAIAATVLGAVGLVITLITFGPSTVAGP
jgi:hypothetical protein